MAGSEVRLYPVSRGCLPYFHPLQQSCPKPGGIDLGIMTSEACESSVTHGLLDVYRILPVDTVTVRCCSVTVASAASTDATITAAVLVVVTDHYPHAILVVTSTNSTVIAPTATPLFLLFYCN